MSEWSTHTSSGDFGREKRTRHRSPDRMHSLDVISSPDSHGITHTVRLGEGGVRQVFSFSTAGRAATFFRDGNFKDTPLPSPSPDLLTMIEHHHADPTNSWQPLLDKLAEEYPEHFLDAVNQHVAARNSDSATHFARAFTSASESVG